MFANEEEGREKKSPTKANRLHAHCSGGKKKPRAFGPHGSESSGSLTAVGWLGSSRLRLLIQQLSYPAAALEVLHGGETLSLPVSQDSIHRI